MPRGNILLIWTRMGDYHRARWNALKNSFSEGKVFAADAAAADQLYGWVQTGNDPLYQCFSERRAEENDTFRKVLAFWSLVRSENVHHVFIPGYGRPEYIWMLLLTWISGRRAYLFAESWYGGSKSVNFVKGRFLDLFCSGFLVSGQRAAQHFNQRLGISEKKIRIGYSVVDNIHFNRPLETPYNPSSKILLCVARFSPEKNLELLIEAFQKSGLPSLSWQLKLVGGGPLLERLTEITQTSPSISLHSWVSYDKLPSIYHEAAAFVLPSTFEPWGLVVNEAMAAGLPLLLSNEVGCCPDLLTNKNGKSFDSNDLQDMIQAMQWLGAANTDELKAMSAVSLSLIDQFSTTSWTSNILDLIQK